MSIHLFRRRALVIAGGSLVGSVLYLHNRARYGDDAMYSNKESYRPSFLFSTARRLPIVAEAQQQEQQQQLRDSVGSDGSPSEDFSSCMMREPRSLRDRFLQYARRDEETGEYVQLLGDFVACILLLDSDHSSNSLLFNSNNNNSSSSSLGKSSSADTASSSSSSRMTFPSSVQHRVEALFEMVDIDSSKSVTYAEFVVLFTLLSTRYSTLKLAFNMFDLDDNGRLDELEFSRLLNTVMVDPAVQIQYRDPQRVAAADDHAGVLDASSVAGAAWGSRRTRSRKGGPELSYSISSDSLSRWLRGVLPHHTDAPRGSKHHKGGGIYRTFVQAHELARLHRMNEEDHAQRAISFENFWYRVHYLRWELRAIEFSILDTTHTGMISIDACRRLLVGKGAAATAMHTGASTEASPSLAVSAADARVSSPWWSWTSLLSYIGLSCRPSAPTQPRPTDEHTPCISWQFYQKIFDIIRDSDLTLPALQLALDAAPPLSSEDLQGGAVPDEKRALSSVCHHQYDADVKQCGQQLPAGTSWEAAEGEALHTHSTATNTTTTTNNNNNNNITGTTPSPLVRPTALTYRQFNAALRSCDHFLPVLSEEEQRIFCELFDFDKSGTLTPSEFAQLCEMKRSFFAQRLPAFSQPRRNPVQQFFYCMQQLD